jgi:hypothetical protein
LDRPFNFPFHLIGPPKSLPFGSFLSICPLNPSIVPYPYGGTDILRSERVTTENIVDFHRPVLPLLEIWLSVLLIWALGRESTLPHDEITAQMGFRVEA